jgi:drug/metabolite transporter (DMT)-like permease
VFVARIGSARAGYATVLFPIVALAISTVLEGYNWTPLAMIGVALILVGNVIMFWRPRKRGIDELLRTPGHPTTPTQAEAVVREDAIR